MPIWACSKTSVALICVGSELLRGKPNTHASTLASRLASIGLELSEENTFGDEPGPLTEGIRRALLKHAVVIITGGLGPTFDDISREAASAATGRSLRLSKKLLKKVRQKFRRAHYRMPPANARQAELLEGADVIPNNVGTAPGQWLGLRPRQVLILLPGPPSELHPMLEDFVLPHLKKAFPAQPVAEAHLHFVGLPESVVDHRVRPIIQRVEKIMGGQVGFTILAHLGLVDFDVFATAATRLRAIQIRDRIVTDVRRRMGKNFYGMDPDSSLEVVTGNIFRHQKATLAVAESCTGGWLGRCLTKIPGSSRYFLGGVIAYSNKAKTRLLRIPVGLLKRYGAVSRPVAAAMAKGVRRCLGSQVGLSITGIAGPDGGTPRKPVGLVYIGVSSRKTTRTYAYRFFGSREAIRQRAVIAALDILRTVFKGR
ncbi:MAG: CinA family nicotinamide mononucleotide deamidase-related protein [Elusimicrobiota bacterium]|jgi:nicotinamide-nucleotide amidase